MASKIDRLKNLLKDYYFIVSIVEIMLFLICLVQLNMGPDKIGRVVKDNLYKTGMKIFKLQTITEILTINGL